MKLQISVLVTAAVLLTGCGPAAERDAAGNIVTQGAVDAFEIKVGDCFNDSEELLDSEPTDAVSGVPCTLPHDNEVYSVFDVTMDKYPGSDSMSEMATQACIDRFEAFVGAPYDTSELDTFALYPTQMSWSMHDDREVICAVYRVDEGKLTETMQGKGI